MLKIIYKGKEIAPYETFYWNATERFFRGQLGGVFQGALNAMIVWLYW